MVPGGLALLDLQFLLKGGLVLGRDHELGGRHSADLLFLDEPADVYELVVLVHVVLAAVFYGPKIVLLVGLAVGLVVQTAFFLYLETFCGGGHVRGRVGVGLPLG
jgi:hypothetical protein